MHSGHYEIYNRWNEQMTYEMMNRNIIHKTDTSVFANILFTLQAGEMPRIITDSIVMSHCNGLQITICFLQPHTFVWEWFHSLGICFIYLVFHVYIPSLQTGN